MGFWSRLTKGAPPEDAPPPAAAPHVAAAAPSPEPSTPSLPPDVARLGRSGEEGGPAEAEALALLRTLRNTADEGLALDVVVRRSQTHPLPEALAIAVSSALLDRGDRVAARAVLDGLSGSAALLLRADMMAEERDFAGAVATIERVLVRDLDAPGARERRLAWRTRLGLAESERRIDPATMTVATSHASTPFDLVREVARGGAGAVFAARDRELGRTVALKLYHSPDRDRARLLHEGRVAAELEGPGVVRVFDVEPDEGWLALEWASLGALRDLLARAAFADGVDGADAPADAQRALTPLLRWVPQLAEALARVHAAGWVHHDVKPANVLMSVESAGAGPGEAVPWLADFGSARRVGEPSPPGSMGYVSPERLAGRVSDPRDDVYGFARVLDEVLAVVQDDPERSLFSQIAEACRAPGDGRPADGSAVVALLRGR